MTWSVAAATHAVRDRLAQDAPATLAALAQAGFAGIDLSDSAAPIDLPGQGWRPLAAMIRDHGLAIPALNLLRAGLAHPEHAATGITRIRRAIAAAEDLGAGVVSLSLAIPREVGDCNIHRGGTVALGSSRDATDDDVARTADALRPLVHEAAEAGTALCIEMHHASLADSAASCLRLWRAVGDGRLGINPDLVNAYWAYAEPEEDWAGALRALAPHANLWHVKNVRRRLTAPGRAEYSGTALGQGDIDDARALRIMRDAGFAGWISIERGGPDGDALAQMREGFGFIRQWEQDNRESD